MLGIGRLFIDDNTGRVACPNEQELWDLMANLDALDVADAEDAHAWTDKEIAEMASISDQAEDSLITHGERLSDVGYRT